MPLGTIKEVIDSRAAKEKIQGKSGISGGVRR